MSRRTAPACVAALSLLTAAVAAAGPAHAAPVHRSVAAAHAPVRNTLRLANELGVHTPLNARSLAAAARSSRPAAAGDPVTPIAIGKTGGPDDIPKTVVAGTPQTATFFVASPTLQDSDGNDAPVPTGTITFYEVDDQQKIVGTALGTVALTPDLSEIAVAEATTPDFSIGELHDVVATYSGDANYAPLGPAAPVDAFDGAIPAYAEVVSVTPGATQDLERLYIDFLGRNPDADGLAYWQTVLKHGGYGDAAFSFSLSDERLSDEIAGSYELVLGRAVDDGGLAYYLDLFHKGLTVPTLQVLLSLSPEFSGKAVANEDYVAALYYVFLNRLPDDGGFAYYTMLLDKHLETRAQMAGEFSYSAEHDALILTGLYANFLDRVPDVGGVAYWTAAIRNDYRQELIAFSMSISTEYRNLLTPPPPA